MIWWYLLAAYLGFGVLTAVLMWHADWCDEDVAVAAFFVWPVFWAAGLYTWIETRMTDD